MTLDKQIKEAKRKHQKMLETTSKYSGTNKRSSSPKLKFKAPNTSLEHVAKPTRTDVDYLKKIVNLVSVISVIAGFVSGGVQGLLVMGLVVFLVRGVLYLFP